MNLLIRADANFNIGTGHVMRCLALAQAWRDRGGDATFLGQHQSDSLRQRISSEGFALVVVERPHPDPADLIQVLELLRSIEKSKNGQWLVLDGYQFGPEYQKPIRESGFKLLVMDDYNHQSSYHADIVLNQNVGSEHFQYACDPDTVLLLGTKYVLLRKEFLAWKEKIRAVPKVAGKILVTLGGADPDNFMLMVIQALKLVNITGLEAKIVVGPTNPHVEKLEREIQCDRTEEQAFQIVQGGNMPELMSWADIAVSAGGSTCWELAFMGVPFLSIVLADNQVPIASGLDEFGATVNLGWYTDLSERELASHLACIIPHQELRSSMSKKGLQLVDGLGAKRVIERLLEV
jgi:UDP-2,4-diacetamido-2,4,6-trideoxy-beta-L-altropyranose hydrolase